MTQRITRRLKCLSCNGSGIHRTSISVECALCSGNGWIIDGDDGEAVCPICNGDGVMSQPADRKCSKCSGKGFIVQVVEQTPINEPCTDCSGRGYIATGVMRECKYCNGIGQVVKEKTFVCETCEGAGQVDPYKESPIFEECDDAVCPDCMGAGFVKENVFKPCKKCDESGFVKKISQCASCEGRGYIFTGRYEERIINQ
ncbi:MAG: hypothetical protein EOM12_03860 [Verrucomicrobiae bacterium]|nr:hypothetical protein [Verrucomicrobiae bacterium]